MPRIFRNKPASPSFLTRNGEMLLRMQVSFSQGRSNPIRTFTLRELREATHNFAYTRRQVFGLSGYYWGVVDGRKVVVKNMNTNSGSDYQDRIAAAHITEIAILSTIRHRNVVRLLGCCLETRVPLLVYEFVPNGNLLDNMDRWRLETPPWSTRLQIAIDVADALNYLHCYTSRPVVHRYMQPKVIFLDGDYAAKLSGFSYSVPIPLGRTQVEDEVISGAYGYVDPEYATTNVLTEKADIYPFGVILIELQTGVRFSNYLHGEGKDVILEVMTKTEHVQEPPGNHGESTISGEAMREKQLGLEEACLAILVADASATEDAEEKTEQFREFAKLALKCARPRMQERPTMKEVVEELRRIRTIALA